MIPSTSKFSPKVAFGLFASAAIGLLTTSTVRADSTLRLLPVRDLENDAGEFSLLGLKFPSNSSTKQATVQRFLGGAPVNAPASAVHVLRNSANKGNNKKSSVDLQVNEPALDHVQNFTGIYPFEFATQSETTVCSDGNHIVTSYNTSAGAEIVEYQGDLYFTEILLSGYSVSHDGGKSWKSGFVAPVEGSIGTFGDGALAKDRKGNFYYAGLGLDENFQFGIIVNKSSDHGDSFAPAKVVALDDGGDKEWIAVGPDPQLRERDNAYVTWTRFSDIGSELMFSRSTDGGSTWSDARVIYTPVDAGGVMSSYLQFSNPTVDSSNGRLYIPFLHAGRYDADFIRMLVSDDGGQSFKEVQFNVSGAPDHGSFPIIGPGLIGDCGKSGGIRLIAKQGPDIGGGIWSETFGFPRFVHCTRLIEQPSTAADRGRVAMAVNRSTSAFIGDPAAGSEITLLYSSNGGLTWTIGSAIPSTTADPLHFHPALSLAQNGNSAYVGYYVQQANEQFRTDLAVFQLADKKAILKSVCSLSSVAFDLPPNNIPDPNDLESTVNYDQILVPGYSLGEYMGVAADDSGVALCTWGDSRQTWGSPVDSYNPGSHPQADVYFRKLSVK